MPGLRLRRDLRLTAGTGALVIVDPKPNISGRVRKACGSDLRHVERRSTSNRPHTWWDVKCSDRGCKRYVDTMLGLDSWTRPRG